MALLPFTVFYSKPSGSQQVAATALTVTFTLKSVKLSDNTLVTLVNAQPAFEVGNGLYGYTYSGALDFTLYYYVGTFHTADASVQAQDVASAWFDYVVPGGITEQKITLPAEAPGPPSTALQLLMWLAGCFGWRKVVKDATTIKQYMADGVTVKTSSSYSSVSGTDTIDKAV